MNFSVITVAYNSIETISKCCHSVATQNQSSVEHILVDGGSDDGTAEFLAQYAASNENVQLTSEPDDGIYNAMNKGLSQASGDIICILNSDDYFQHSEVLSSVYNLFDLHSECEAILTGIQFCNAEGRVLRKVDPKWFRPNRLSYGWMPPHPGIFLKRSVYDSIGGYKEDYKIAADYEFCIRAFLVKKIGYKAVSDTTVNMRLGGVSTNGLLSVVTITREIVRACRDNGIRPKIILLILRLPLKKLLQHCDR